MPKFRITSIKTNMDQAKDKQSLKNIILLAFNLENETFFWWLYYEMLRSNPEIMVFLLLL